MPHIKIGNDLNFRNANVGRHTDMTALQVMKCCYFFLTAIITGSVDVKFARQEPDITHSRHVPHCTIHASRFLALINHLTQFTSYQPPYTVHILSSEGFITFSTLISF